MITKREVCFSGSPRYGKSIFLNCLYAGICPKCNYELTMSTLGDNIIFKCDKCNIAFVKRKEKWMDFPEEDNSNNYKDIHEIFKKIRESYYDEPTRIMEIMKDDPGFKAFFQKYDNIIKGRLKKRDLILIHSVDTNEELMFEPMVYPMWEDFVEQFKKRN